MDYLKIDRSFMHGLGRDSENKAIVLGMIGLAHAVGLKTVAEGVEFAEQLAQLRAMRCDMAKRPRSSWRRGWTPAMQPKRNEKHGVN